MLPAGVNSSLASQVLAKLASLLLLLYALGPKAAMAEGAVQITDIELAGSMIDSPPANTADWRPEHLPWFTSFRHMNDLPPYLWMRFSLPAATTSQALFVSRHTRNLVFT